MVAIVVDLNEHIFITVVAAPCISAISGKFAVWFPKWAFNHTKTDEAFSRVWNADAIVELLYAVISTVASVYFNEK